MSQSFKNVTNVRPVINICFKHAHKCLGHKHPGYNNGLRHKRLTTKVPVTLTHLLFICHASSLIPSFPIALCVIFALLTPSLSHTHTLLYAFSLPLSLSHKSVFSPAVQRPAPYIPDSHYIPDFVAPKICCR